MAAAVRQSLSIVSFNFKFNLSRFNLERINGRQVMERPKNKQTALTALTRSTVCGCDATKSMKYFQKKM